MKNKGLKKVLCKADLLEDVSSGETNEDTSTSHSDEEEMRRLEKKYGLRPG
jgi:hypothetical protein